MSHGTRSGEPRTDDPVPAGRHAVVVGGGLAGVTAALALADAGVRVTLLEGRPRLVLITCGDRNDRTGVYRTRIIVNARLLPRR